MKKIILISLIIILGMSSLAFSNAADPGIPSGKAGSILIYPMIDSSSSSPDQINTRISIINTNPIDDVAVRFYLVYNSGGYVNYYDAICLTPNQAFSFLLSDFDPDIRGYIIAIAVDPVTGEPVSFDYLIGDEYVKRPTTTTNPISPSEGLISAEIYSFSDLSIDPGTGLLSLTIPGNAMAIPSIPSSVAGNKITFAHDVLWNNPSTIQFFGLLFDDAGTPFSYMYNLLNNQYVGELSDTFPRTTPRFTTVIPAGRTGWTKIYAAGSNSANPDAGAVFIYNPNAQTQANAFNSAITLPMYGDPHTVVLPIDPGTFVPPYCF